MKASIASGVPVLSAHPLPASARRGLAGSQTRRPHAGLCSTFERQHLPRAASLKKMAPVRDTPWGLEDPVILFAPYVSPEMAALLVSHGIDFVDRAGNCHLDLGGRYVAHVEGRRLRQLPDAPGGTRAPGFRLIFSLLVDQDLLNVPTRELARASTGEVACSAEAGADSRARGRDLVASRVTRDIPHDQARGPRGETRRHSAFTSRLNGTWLTAATETTPGRPAARASGDHFFFHSNIATLRTRSARERSFRNSRRRFISRLSKNRGKKSS